MANLWWLVPAVFIPGAVMAARSWWRELQPTPPSRTPADVLRDAAIHRGCRQLAQAIDDADTCWQIWPDPPSWRIAHTQYLLDRRRETDQ